MKRLLWFILIIMLVYMATYVYKACQPPLPPLPTPTFTLPVPTDTPELTVEPTDIPTVVPTVEPTNPPGPTVTHVPTAIPTVEPAKSRLGWHPCYGIWIYNPAFWIDPSSCVPERDEKSHSRMRIIP